MRRPLGQSGLTTEPLVLGGNVFGWTADETTSFAVLDAFVGEGFGTIDTADVYSRWAPGNDSESERIIGRWMRARGARDRVVLCTKVGMTMGLDGRDLRASRIVAAVEDSLTRLQTDVIDLYQTHWPDPATPEEETLAAYDRLIRAGKVRAIGTCNYDEGLLRRALDLSAAKGLPRYQTVQNEFNLLNRAAYEGPVQQICVAEGLGAIPYYGLSAGFLTGKYRTKADLKGARAGSAERFMTPRGMAVLEAMDGVAARTGAALAEIALAWIIAQPGIAGPIASATSLAQVQSLIRGARLVLPAEELATLSAAG